MAKLNYTSENKRIATADHKSVANIPTEDTENERVELSYGISPVNPVLPNLVLLSEGYYGIEGQPITEEYIDPQTLGLTIDNDGYASIPE